MKSEMDFSLSFTEFEHELKTAEENLTLFGEIVSLLQIRIVANNLFLYVRLLKYLSRFFFLRWSKIHSDPTKIFYTMMFTNLIWSKERFNILEIF